MEKRPQVQYQEPQELGRALQVWTPWVRPLYPTPREGKRYINLVRYVAMRAEGEKGKNRLSPQDAVYASAVLLRPRPLDDPAAAQEFDGLLAEHTKVFGVAPAPDATTLFQELSREVQTGEERPRWSQAG